MDQCPALSLKRQSWDALYLLPHSWPGDKPLSPSAVQLSNTSLQVFLLPYLFLLPHSASWVHHSNKPPVPKFLFRLSLGVKGGHPGLRHSLSFAFFFYLRTLYQVILLTLHFLICKMKITESTSMDCYKFEKRSCLWSVWHFINKLLLLKLLNDYYRTVIAL